MHVPSYKPHTHKVILAREEEEEEVMTSSTGSTNAHIVHSIGVSKIVTVKRPHIRVSSYTTALGDDDYTPYAYVSRILTIIQKSNQNTCTRHVIHAAFCLTGCVQRGICRTIR